MNILVQISISCMCNQAFSCSTTIKSKDINRLISVEDELHVCLSKVRPRIKYLCTKNKHRFYIKEVYFILNFTLKNNTVLDYIFVHIAFMYLTVFSSLTIQHCQ
jgi:hypothetical protein